MTQSPAEEAASPNNDHKSIDHSSDRIGTSRTASHDEAQSVIDEAYLTTEEISQLRKERNFGDNFKGWAYDIGDETFSLLDRPIKIEKIQNDDHKRDIVELYKRREEGEQEVCETVMVNALRKQTTIAGRFGLPLRGLYTSLKMDYVAPPGGVLMGNFGDLYMATLSKHVDNLRRQGLDELSIATELAGHVFHEAVHQGEDGLDAALLDGRHSVGEVTTIAAQLAYYATEGFFGFTSYTAKNCAKGREKILAGTTNLLDYDIATCIATHLLLEELLTVTPTEDTNDPNPLTSFQRIAKGFPSGERAKLVPALKKAIARSANPAEIDAVCERIKSGA